MSVRKVLLSLQYIYDICTSGLSNDSHINQVLHLAGFNVLNMWVHHRGNKSLVLSHKSFLIALRMLFTTIIER